MADAEQSTSLGEDMQIAVESSSDKGHKARFGGRLFYRPFHLVEKCTVELIGQEWPGSLAKIK